MNPPDETARATILIVEDQPDMRALLRLALESAGHNIEEAERMAGAREALCRAPVNLVLCDFHLEAGESGLDVLRELAPRSPDIAVVMLTGDTDMRVAIDCLRNGAFDYVLKPFSVEELQDVIARALDRQRRMIGERQRVEDRVSSPSRLSSHNPNPVLRIARNGVILYANPAGLTLLGPLHCRIGETAPQFLVDILRKDVPGEAEVEIAGRTFSFAVAPIPDTGDFCLFGHDITRFKETERELVRLNERAQTMALHDPLTGLPNRTLLDDRLAQAIALCSRQDKKLAVAFIDLDNFKRINDTHGHQVGDRILVEVTRQVSAAIRKTDTVARWGGDELILLLPGLNAPSHARAVCERVKRTVQAKLAGDPLTSRLTLSMGIAICPGDASLPEALIQRADTALYRAKAQGGNSVVLFGETGGPNGAGVG